MHRRAERVAIGIVAIALTALASVAWAQPTVTTPLADTGFVQVVTEPGIDVYLDDEFVGRTSAVDGGLLIFRAAPGLRTVALLHERDRHDVDVLIEAGTVRVLEVRGLRSTIKVYEEGDDASPNPDVAFGRLVLQCLPVQCTVNAPDLGLTSYVKTRDRLVIDGVPVGPYQLRVGNDERTLQVNVDVCRDAETIAFVNLIENPPTVTFDGDVGPLGCPIRDPAPRAPQVILDDDAAIRTENAIAQRERERGDAGVATTPSGPVTGEIRIDPVRTIARPGVPVAFRVVLANVDPSDLVWLTTQGRIVAVGEVAVLHLDAHSTGAVLVTALDAIDRRVVATARVDVLRPDATETAPPPSTGDRAPGQMAPSTFAPDATLPAPTSPRTPESEPAEPPEAPPPSPPSTSDGAAAPTNLQEDAVASAVASTIRGEDGFSRITVERPRIAAENGSLLLQFDLRWPDSWRGNERPAFVQATNNWDAAWVFAKYRTSERAPWTHVPLAQHGHLAPVGTTIDPSEDGVGAFVYRANDGTGEFYARNVGLLWDADDLDSSTLEVVVYALEMVFVPAGTYFLGSGGDGIGEFRAGGTEGQPFLVERSGAIELGSDAGQLGWDANQTSGRAEGATADGFPNGFDSFYVMKHPVTQGAYAAFVRTLDAPQRASWLPTPRSDANLEGRYGIDLEGDEVRTSQPFLPMPYLAWSDAAAFARWAGLRPMSELEYEKAARGPLEPIANEFAWGADDVAVVERVVPRSETFEQLLPVEANAVASGLIGGPAMVGVTTVSGRDRSLAGASYWGVLDLSGGLWERVVSVGTVEGRAFVATPGDGVALEPMPSWPALDGRGLGFRGGGWVSDVAYLRVSDRSFASFANGARDSSIGFRAAR